jgi:hypothetical protein
LTLMGIWRQEYITDAMLEGCNYFNKSISYTSVLTQQKYGASLCDVDDIIISGRRTLRSMCPITCGCNTTVKAKYLTQGVPPQKAVVESQCPVLCLV